MPDGITSIPMEEILTLEEIAEICRQAAALGISKIKVTGGEPLVRLGCVELVRMLRAMPGISQATLTTNGVLLPRYAEELHGAGINAINISLDTLDRAEYKEITGFDALADVLDGISSAIDCKIPVKINAVLQNDDRKAYAALAELARQKPIDVRFIELMPIGHGKGRRPVSNDTVLKRLGEIYGELKPDGAAHGNGPAVYYKIPGFQGGIGFISAIHGKFCGGCNRIRLTSTGQLKPCLCYGDGVSVKEAVRGGQTEEVRRLILKAVMEKPKGHSFGEAGLVTEHREMVKIGG